MKTAAIKLFKHPVLGLLSIAIGWIIINAGLSVHSGEIFLWLLGLFGFMFLFPVILLVKSIQNIRSAKTGEEKEIRHYAILFTVAFVLLWFILIAGKILEES